jgi:hypothetical protein
MMGEMEIAVNPENRGQADHDMEVGSVQGIHFMEELIEMWDFSHDQ